MTRQIYVFRQDASGKYQAIEVSALAASESRAPGIICDSMQALEHPCDGRVYDSKSAFRRVTKAFGMEEKGNDGRYQKPSVPRENRQLQEAVNKTFAQYGLD